MNRGRNHLLALILLISASATDKAHAQDRVKAAAQKDIQQSYRTLSPADVRNLPIGVFDSGTGGLTVLEQILTIDSFDNQTQQPAPRGDQQRDFKNESFVFLADQANMPYGNYPVVGQQNFLEDLIVKDAWFLMGGQRLPRNGEGTSSQNVSGSRVPVKAVVIACNTATAFGQDDIEEVIHAAGMNIKVVGVIDAGAKGALESLQGQDGTIGIVPTKGTVLSNAYPEAIAARVAAGNQKQTVNVVQQGAFGLAGAIDGATDFIDADVTNCELRNDYRGPCIGSPEAAINVTILKRYAFDFSDRQMLYEGPVSSPTQLQINSVRNYISYHLVSLLEQIRTSTGQPPLRAVVLGCTHFPFYEDVFHREIERLRDYQEDGTFVYRHFMADSVELIDPAFYTARELYEVLAADDRVRTKSETSGQQGEFCITIPRRQIPGVNLNSDGDFTYEFKYGRKPGRLDSAFEAVPLNDSTVDEKVMDRLKQRVPAVWQLMERNRQPQREKDVRLRVRKIEQIIAEDIGSRRGIEPLAESVAGDLYAAARSIAEHPRPNVGIITGFYFPYANPPACETDGPPGAAHIAAAFHRAGIPCRVATDMPNAPVVHAALWGAGVPSSIPVDLVSLNGGRDGAGKLQDVINAWKNAHPPITHVISVERGGPAADGKPHNFSGDDISQFNAPLERLFEAGDWVTIGIGDGGNEMGMGKLPAELISRHIRNGDRVACVTGCDHLIVCGTSNWGGWALPAAISLIRADLRQPLMEGINRQTDFQILKTAVDKGRAAALESFAATKAYPGMSVDALPWSVHARKLDELLKVLQHEPTATGQDR